MAADLLDALARRVLISTGATGTNLASRGMDMGECVVKWELEHPQEVEDLMRQFIDAGSEVIEVGSGGANRFRLQPYGLQDHAAEFNFQLARLWREMTPVDCFLLGSIGVTSRFLKPAGNLTFEEMYEGYCEQIENLARGGVEGFWMVTMSDILETGAAIKAAKDCTGLPVIASMVFDSTPKGFYTMMGADAGTSARELQRWGADVVGTNCGGTPFRFEDIPKIIEEMKAACDRYLVAKPNAGAPRMMGGQMEYQIYPEEMAREALKWISAGARIVGGCCGTTPEHIAKMVEFIHKEGISNAQ
jgi:5-methyltetrahydrofolate--homocysteine methyltransferase